MTGGGGVGFSFGVDSELSLHAIIVSVRLFCLTAEGLLPCLHTGHVMSAQSGVYTTLCEFFPKDFYPPVIMDVFYRGKCIST